jgi:outer membrane protein OmpA-like peptidoglycan-associated protein/tetratricopeptide (TPR) repeat protein
MYRFLLFLILCLPTAISAQDYLTEKEVSGRVEKLYRSAQSQFRSGQAQEALESLEKVLEKSPTFIDAWLFYADLQLRQKDYAGAEASFEQALSIAPDYAALAYYLLGQTEFEQQKFAEAVTHFQTYLDSGKVSERLLEEAEQWLRNATFAQEAVQQPVPFLSTPLSSAINTDKPEYLPSISADGRYLVYTSRLQADNEDIMISEWQDSSWQPGRPVVALNTPFNDSSPSIAANGQSMVFARNDQRNNFDLYYARQSNGQWEAPERLPAPVNSGAFDSQPALSADGKELYFVSDRQGGKGQLDLWMSNKKADGNWGKPINLGNTINTSLNEQAPFIHPDGQTLYFMSKGHPGMGNYDLYLSRRQSDGSWGKPMNLGYPINARENEGAIIVSLDGQTAYFDSDKADPTGQNREMGNADIFQFPLHAAAQPQPATYVQAKVRDESTKRPLQADVSFVRLKDGQLHTEDQTNEKGQFLVVLPMGEDYALNVSKAGYLFHSEHFALAEAAAMTDPKELLIELRPIPKQNETESKDRKPIILRNVFFDTGSSVLRSESASELQRLVALLEQNPDMHIRINGHTDNVGQPEENQALSEARAKAVYEYLSEQGISNDRLAYKGFGESRPVDSNETPEGRQRNRRTEFEVVAY